MQHHQHPDEALFQAYFSAMLPALFAKVIENERYNDLDGPELRGKIIKGAANVAETAVSEHRRRFPLPTIGTVPTDRPGGDWDPRFGNRPNLSEIKPDLYVVTGAEILNAFERPITETPGRILENFKILFESYGAKTTPQWVKDLCNSTEIQPADKIRVYNALFVMLKGKVVNLDSQSIKGAFTFTDAPNGSDFWFNIAACLPPVVDYSTGNVDFLTADSLVDKNHIVETPKILDTDGE